mmetsp:Transcript_69035/g.165632  ORF Transcript_69035/g.165632 Transcript_69035/m.165632 type:complete len:218 (+) Transcript_69035:691-1344(+)
MGGGSCCGSSPRSPSRSRRGRALQPCSHRGAASFHQLWRGVAWMTRAMACRQPSAGAAAPPHAMIVPPAIVLSQRLRTTTRRIKRKGRMRKKHGVLAGTAASEVTVTTSPKVTSGAHGSGVQAASGAATKSQNLQRSLTALLSHLQKMQRWRPKWRSRRRKRKLRRSQWRSRRRRRRRLRRRPQLLQRWMHDRMPQPQQNTRASQLLRTAPKPRRRP